MTTPLPPIFFNIDVVGACNLRCPSCPVGNTDYKLPKGFMEPATLQRIMTKAHSECRVMGVGLFNWTEPILHPLLPGLIRIVQDSGSSAYLSSNLNAIPRLDEVMAANPYSFRISVSGFTQEVYGYTHRGGQIERVKRHMRELVAARDRHKATTRIHVLWHRYKHNVREEPLMRAFAASLGIRFEPVWAFMMPMEKILAYVNDDPREATLTKDDHQLIANLALPLREAIAESERHKTPRCVIQDNQITLDYQGDVQLCCATYDPRRFTVGNYLCDSLAKLQARKEAHSMCGRCMARGANVYATYGTPGLDVVAARHLGVVNARFLGLRAERGWKWVRRKLEWFGRFLTPEQSARLGDVCERWAQAWHLH